MGFMTFFHIECCTQAEVRAPLIYIDLQIITSQVNSTPKEKKYYTNLFHDTRPLISSWERITKVLKG